MDTWTTEFRHASWWNKDVYSAFREAGIIFCSCSGPRMPDELRTADEVYISACTVLNAGIRRDYSDDELLEWANKTKASGAKRACIYFNNDNDAYAPKNALVLRRLLADGVGCGTAKRKRGRSNNTNRIAFRGLNDIVPYLPRFDLILWKRLRSFSLRSKHADQSSRRSKEP
jgi:uncharacterized protein DUF72